MGFAFHSLLVLFAALFLFGMLGALFGPVKYGILPDLLAREELPAGNALIEGGTFLAILLGTIMAGIRRQGRQQSDPFRLADDPDRIRWLGCRPPSYRRRVPGAPELEDQPQYFRFHRLR